MKGHRLLAWGLLAAFVVVLGAAVVAGSHPAREDPIGLTDALWASSFIGFPAAGALIASRFPRSPLGWLLCIAPVLLMFGVFAGDQATVLEVTGASDRSVAVWTWVSHVVFESGVGLMALLPLLVPDGRLPSRRWRPIAALLAAVVTMSVISLMIRPGPMIATNMRNPFGVAGAAGIADAMRAVVGVAMPMLSLLALASIFIRFRGSRGIERQQIKWLAYGAAAMLGFLALLVLLDALGMESGPVATLLFIPMILSIPIAMAVAMLRYRLYDVDVVINKTLVYAALTAILALSYLAVVVILQRVFGGFVEDSDLAVAGSTLAVAAMFRPLRSRVQRFIDRRFYRNRYDVAETLEAFSGRLRDEVDLDSLRGEIVGVVRSTMQPTHASLWLKQGGAS